MALQSGYLKITDPRSKKAAKMDPVVFEALYDLEDLVAPPTQRISRFCRLLLSCKHELGEMSVLLFD